MQYIYFLVFYRCMPVMLSSSINALGIINVDGSKVNGSDIELGQT